MADLLSALDWITALLFAGAIGMTALSQKEIRYARLVVWIATTLFLARWGAWAFMSDQSWIVKAIVGACVGAFVFGAIPPALNWIKSKSATPSSPLPATDKPQSTAPPQGALRYVTSSLILEPSHSTHQVAGQIKVEIKNESDKLIFFHAVTAGNINGMAFDVKKVEFDGYISPHESSYLLSNRLTGLIENKNASATVPSFRAIYEYDLQYRYADEKGFSRRSAKGLDITYWPKIPFKSPSSPVMMIPITVRLYSEIEE